MSRLADWIRDHFGKRPWWMNAAMVTCAFLAYVYTPWDFFFKPTAEDQEVWLGLTLTGAAAKLTEPFHFVIYAAGAYGFWRMKPWMWPWASAYAATVTFGMFVWPIATRGGFAGLLLGVASAIPFGLLSYALWDARYLFDPRARELSNRYGEWALVTGASAGIGREFARALAREGINCVLTARREDRLRELAAELEETCDVETRVVAADLTKPEGTGIVAEAVENIELAILVNNAGVGYAGRFEKQDVERLHDMIELNCTTPVVLTHRLLPAMLARGRGAIIIVASVAGRQPLPFLGVYSATKSFDLLFAESLFVELRDKGIDVLGLIPGPVATEFETVAGEERADPDADEQPAHCVRVALDALGNQASVVSGTWLNWLRANANRFLPRSVMAFVAADFTEKQTPSEMR